MKTDDVIVSFRGVRKTYDGETLVVKHLDLDIYQGEFLTLLGPSGSGKSSLLYLLSGLKVPTRGEVCFRGTSLSKLTDEERSALRIHQFGFVFQQPYLLGYLTALENVMLPLELQGDVSTAEMRRRATTLLERVGLGARLSHYPKTLSGGEQQRVALARAFVTEPDILFADEPTGSLDTATGEAVIALMFELNQSAGSTLVLVTHDRSVAARCNRILTIEAGHLVGDETVTEL